MLPRTAASGREMFGFTCRQVERDLETGGGGGRKEGGRGRGRGEGGREGGREGGAGGRESSGQTDGQRERGAVSEEIMRETDRAGSPTPLRADDLCEFDLIVLSLCFVVQGVGCGLRVRGLSTLCDLKDTSRKGCRQSTGPSDALIRISRSPPYGADDAPIAVNAAALAKISLSPSL